MRKTVLLLAAALLVSAPLIAATTTQTYAAAKKAKAAKDAKVQQVDPHSQIWRALDDLARSLSGAAPPAKGKSKAKGKA